MKNILMLCLLVAAAGCSTISKNNDHKDGLAQNNKMYSKNRKPAGSSTVDCANSDKSITFSVGNGDHILRLKYKDSSKKGLSELDYPVALLPEFDYNVDTTNAEIKNVIPVGNEIHLQNKKELSEDGPGGRQYWDHLYQQTMVITGKDNDSAISIYNENIVKSIKQINKDNGYITDVFTCHSYGATTAGGLNPN